MSPRRLLLALVVALVLFGGFAALWSAVFSSGLDFDGEAALAHVAEVVAVGERQVESEGSAAARAVILEALAEAGVEAREESFRLKVPMPDPETGAQREVSVTNVVATVPGASEARICWGTHYDTPAIEGQRIVGANDGASGVGVLLELARRLQQRRSSLAMTHVFVFFDGEEKVGPGPFNASFGDRTANACLGSRAQAREWSRQNLLPRAFVLLDMVGDAKLNIAWESSYSDLGLRNVFERAAREEGLSEYFFRSERPIVDDHVPFVHFGVPSIDLIDFDYGPPSADPERSGGAYWHSPEDTLDKLSARSLAIVGEVCWAAVDLLERKYGR